MRKRFSRRPCFSSERDFQSKAHTQYITECHEANKIVIEKIVTTKYYIKCFGKLMEITKEEAEHLSPKLVITL